MLSLLLTSGITQSPPRQPIRLLPRRRLLKDQSLVLVDMRRSLLWCAYEFRVCHYSPLAFHHSSVSNSAGQPSKIGSAWPNPSSSANHSSLRDSGSFVPHHGQKRITMCDCPPSWTGTPYSRNFGM